MALHMSLWGGKRQSVQISFKLAARIHNLDRWPQTLGDPVGGRLLWSCPGTSVRYRGLRILLSEEFRDQKKRARNKEIGAPFVAQSCEAPLIIY